jgi:hypothetical protein
VKGKQAMASVSKHTFLAEKYRSDFDNQVADEFYASDESYEISFDEKIEQAYNESEIMQHFDVTPFELQLDCQERTPKIPYSVYLQAYCMGIISDEYWDTEEFIIDTPISDYFVVELDDLTLTERIQLLLNECEWCPHKLLNDTPTNVVYTIEEDNGEIVPLELPDGTYPPCQLCNFPANYPDGSGCPYSESYMDYDNRFIYG